MKALLFAGLIVGATVLSGCSLIRAEVGPAVAKQITRYCAEPQASRVLVRTEVNALIAPNRIEVQCAGDTE